MINIENLKIKIVIRNSNLPIYAPAICTLQNIWKVFKADWIEIQDKFKISQVETKGIIQQTQDEEPVEYGFRFKAINWYT